MLIRRAVAASDTTFTDVYGVGPIVAAFLIGYTGDVGRFAAADHYAGVHSMGILVNVRSPQFQGLDPTAFGAWVALIDMSGPGLEPPEADGRFYG